jgi:hypothetical protein
MIVAVWNIRQVVLAAYFVNRPTAFEMQLVDFCLSLRVETFQSEFADVNPALAKITRCKQF